MRVRAFAKINLFLDITERRPDGYHNLDTVMQSVSLFDELLIERASEIVFSCDKKELENEDNLCVRAARAFFERSGIEGGARISLIKNIPTQAGLGGGSADCAAVLYALNGIYNKPLDETELLRLARNLGADVPFCLVGGCIRASGIGEQFGERFAVCDTPIIIVKPPFGVSTKDAFARFSGEKSGFSGDEFAKWLRSGVDSCKDYAFNIFERLCSEREEIERIKASFIENGAVFSLMSGSGSAVYGIFSDTKSRDSAAEKLKQRLEIYSAQFVDKAIIEI